MPLGENQDDVGLQNEGGVPTMQDGARGRSAGRGGAVIKGSGVPLRPGNWRRDEWTG